MTWPILARYSIAIAAGASWEHSPLAAKVLWVVLLLALVARDLGGLRRGRHGPFRSEPTGEPGEDG